MKIALYIMVGSLFLIASFFLYQNSLGAIPFLIGSIFLFFLVHKSQFASKKEEKTSIKNEDPNKNQ
ncbi:hypothetical protein J14TS2_02650 [Bacillus sp. J14TS2]|uniref:hypothetical protein n=1 Tax=Bacillus sp. J14TS2 TaxID=2807188 RepID=UPI001B0AE18C|nr:hypothetical protein [Bacillus sp. J14TS2]GIN69790.1 hypothetical protein J14TS2_02650 [Bacillus sp. J14TS2]